MKKKTVRSSAYDVFGNICSATGPLADIFRHRFSTKLLAPDTGRCHSGYRWYAYDVRRPAIRRDRASG